MKQIILILLITLSSITLWSKRVTFQSLASESESNVQKLEAQSYLLNGSLTISEDDELVVDDGIAVTFNEKSRLTILGKLLADLSDGSSFILSSTATSANPIEIKDSKSSLNIRNIVFEGVSLLINSPNPIKIHECKFLNTRFYSAVNIQTISDGNIISNCLFKDCERPAIQNRSKIDLITHELKHVYNGIEVSRCKFDKCNYSGRTGFAMVDLATGGPYDVVVKDNIIVGSRNAAGGIDVSHLVYKGDVNHNVLIENNEVRDCASGIQLCGPMNARVINNKLIDNRWTIVSIDGGIYPFGLAGMALGIRNESLQMRSNAYVSGNTIKGSLIGILAAYNVDLNLGKDGSVEANAGQNIISGNGTKFKSTKWDYRGESYDPEGNPMDVVVSSIMPDYLPVYAQNNYWPGAETEAEIRARVHGNIIVTPFKNYSGVTSVDGENEENEVYYTIDGKTVGKNDSGSRIIISKKGNKSSKIINCNNR